MSDKNFRLAIVGRPNVGKSTLYNRLAGKKLSIVSDRPGITRDWREAEGHLFDLDFTVIDTAGLEERFDESIPARMRRQTEAALEEADAALFLIDGRAGVTPMDEHFAGWLRKRSVPIILAVNKCENLKAVQSALAEGYALGFGEPVALSAEHGEGLNELYEALIEYTHPPPESSPLEGRGMEGGDAALPNLSDIEGVEDYAFQQEGDDPEKPIKVAIVGRPNVGKSTLLNAIINEQRAMTGPEAGITRDAVSVDWVFEGRRFTLVDTAGMRKKAKVQDTIEKMSVEDARRAIRLAQVVILVLDANAAMEKQDLQIADHVIEEGRALIIAVNKWDAAEDRRETLAELEHRLETSLPQARDLPVVPVSALKCRGMQALLKSVLQVYAVWNRRVPTGPLNRWLRTMESRNPAPLVQGKPNRLKYITQIKTRPPTFALWVSRPDKLLSAYKRYITGGLRGDFEMPGVPIRLLVKKSKNPYA